MLTFACFVNILYVNVKIVHTSHYERKMLVSLTKLLNKGLFYNKLERFSTMTKIMHIL
jgi:hypothetical protein